MIKRNKLGQFIKDSHSLTEIKKGQHLSSKTEFKRGKHYSSKTEFKKGYKHTEKWKKELRKIAKEKGFGKWMKGKRGNQLGGWKGGKYVNKAGYVFIYSPDHPFIGKRRYIREHRLVAEKCLGRYLTKKEVVHHINGIKDDNRPENLYLFSSNLKHLKFERAKIKPKLISNLLTVS